MASLVVVTLDGARIPVTPRPRAGAASTDPLDLVEADGTARWAIAYDGEMLLDGVVQPDATILSEAQIADMEGTSDG